jgi:hypothetical protein
VSLPERTRPPGCITDLMFDAWFAAELPPELGPALEKHIGTCQRCRGRRAALAVDRSAFLTMHPNYVASPGQVARRHKRTVLAGVALGVGAFVTLVVLAREPDVRSLPPAAAETVLGFTLEHAGSSERGLRGQDVHPGDEVRFEYSVRAPAYLAIYSLDARGAVRVLYPQTELAAPVPAGHHVGLGSTVHVDNVLGQQWVFALFCNAAFPIAEPEATLEIQHSLAPSPGCDLSVTDWNNTLF